MNAYKIRLKLRMGFIGLGIKEKEIWDKEENKSFEEPDLNNIEISTDENIVFIQNSKGGYSINVIDLIKAAYDNTCYVGMARLDKIK